MVLMLVVVLVALVALVVLLVVMVMVEVWLMVRAVGCWVQVLRCFASLLKVSKDKDKG